jgi:hypothetical protein
MALSTSDYAALAGVLVVLLAVMVYNQLQARRAADAGGARSPRRGEDDEEHAVHPFLSRFAVHDGDVVGETVSVDGDRLVMKQAGVFKVVPLAQAELQGDEVHLSGFIDWDHAVEEGRSWLEGSRKGADEDVAGQLTRSEDVKSPALEAFRKREARLAGEDPDATEDTDAPATAEADDPTAIGADREGDTEPLAADDSEE